MMPEQKAAYLLSKYKALVGEAKMKEAAIFHVEDIIYTVLMQERQVYYWQAVKAEINEQYDLSNLIQSLIIKT